MGLGSFRVRFVAAAVMILIVWQSVKIWSNHEGDIEVVKEIPDSNNISNDKAGKRPTVQRVDIAVYYEALCPDSRSFVIKQLEPTFRTLGDNVKIQLVPYGKATTTETDDGFQFTCQHGPLECEANMIHACAIDILTETSVHLEFIACMIKNNLSPQNITKTCAEKMHLDVEPILNCSKGSKGSELLALFGRMTDALKPPVSFIPTVTLDKSSDNQPGILKNLLEHVCQRFVIPPKGCI